MAGAGSLSTHERSQGKSWVALLGRRDEPTDGVEDYCLFLGRALEEHGVELKLARVSWAEKGWIRALRDLSRESADWRGRWVILQYTALGWSRWGFPFGALAVFAILRRRGARCAVVFHEHCRQHSGARLRDRFRGSCQDWVIHKLYRSALKAIFTQPLDSVSWLQEGQTKAAFIPIGANIPERTNRRAALPPAEQVKTVIVFGVTAGPWMAHEVEEIAETMREVNGAVTNLRLVVVGRGALEAKHSLAKRLEGSRVELVVRGVLPAEEVAQEFSSAHALLFVRGPLSIRRGSALAGIARGIPIVGYRDGSVSGLLDPAGIESADSGDHAGLARALIQVLTNPSRWNELRERNILVQQNYFSWTRIAERFAAELTP